MATVKVLGNAAVLTSTLKLEDIKLLAKYRPEALELKDDNGEPVFVVTTSCDPAGNCSKYGAAFGGSNQEGQATITHSFGDVENVREYLAGIFGDTLMSLKKLEETVPAAVSAVRAERAAIAESIVLI